MLNRAKNVLLDAHNLYLRNQVLAYYFATVPNVGDLITPYLVHSMTGRKCVRRRSSRFTALYGCGSILHILDGKCVVWGSGAISADKLPSMAKARQVDWRALRGSKTRDLLGKVVPNLGSIPLGDPAVLMPMFYNPSRKKPLYKLGIIPHYVDRSTLMAQFADLGGKFSEVTVLDVAQGPAEFVSKLVQCERVASSSLHGLILADSYNVPNIRMQITPNIIGGDFKFQDYYSTTSSPNGKELIPVRSKDGLSKLLRLHHSAFSVSEFVESKKKLLKAFPASRAKSSVNT